MSSNTERDLSSRSERNISQKDLKIDWTKEEDEDEENDEQT